MSSRVLAIDIGGTKLAAGIVDEHGVLGEHGRVPTEGDVFGALAALIDTLPWQGVDAVGVGSGGPMTVDGEEVSPLNIPSWRGFPLRSRLIEHTQLPVFIDNDAKAVALGEGWKGAAQGVQNYVGMVVSTGVGGGVVLDGRLLDGNEGNAGHIGHVIVEPEGLPCACGGYGCLEAHTSGNAIARMTGRPAVDAPDDLRAQTGTYVGRAVASTANLLDLQLAVVGGSVALGFGDIFFKAAQAEIDARCQLSYARSTRIVPAALGENGPLIGAAKVAYSNLRQ
jgi:glucokinase